MVLIWPLLRIFLFIHSFKYLSGMDYVLKPLEMIEFSLAITSLCDIIFGILTI